MLGVIAVLQLSPFAGARAEPAGHWVEAGRAELRLIAATTAVAADGSLSAGLHVRIEPGWKIYWRFPGDAGIAPGIDWSGSENLAGADIRWPAPVRFTAGNVESFGYGDEVVLPLAVRALAPDRPLRLAATVDFGICREICIPQEVRLGLELPPGPARPAVTAPLIARFDALVPSTAPRPDLRLLDGRLERADGLRLVVRAAADPPFAGPDLLVEGPEGVRFGRPAVEILEQGAVAEFRLPVDGPLPEAAELVLTLVDGERAIERRLRPRGP